MDDIDGLLVILQHNGVNCFVLEAVLLVVSVCITAFTYSVWKRERLYERNEEKAEITETEAEKTA